jgi:hypothetical protein
MWQLLLLLLGAGTTAANTTTTDPLPAPSSLPANKPNIGLGSPPPIVGVPGPFGKPIVGASGLGQGPRYGPNKGRWLFGNNQQRPVTKLFFLEL